jgi:hypothetical protein
MAEPNVIDRTIVIKVETSRGAELMKPIKIDIPEILSLRIAMLLVEECVKGGIKRGLRAALIAVGVGK